MAKKQQPTEQTARPDWKTDTARCITEKWITGTFPVIEEGPKRDRRRRPNIDPEIPHEVLEDNGDTMLCSYVTTGTH